MKLGKLGGSLNRILGRVTFCLETEIQQLTKESLDITWSKYLSNDWIPANKSGRVSFQVDKFYIDVKWEKEEEGIGRRNQTFLDSMYDLLNVGNLSAANVLVEGKIYTLEQHVLSTQCREPVSCKCAGRR